MLLKPVLDSYLWQSTQPGVLKSFFQIDFNLNKSGTPIPAKIHVEDGVIDVHIHATVNGAPPSFCLPGNPNFSFKGHIRNVEIDDDVFIQGVHRNQTMFSLWWYRQTVKRGATDIVYNLMALLRENIQGWAALPERVLGTRIYLDHDKSDDKYYLTGFGKLLCGEPKSIEVLVIDELPAWTFENDNYAILVHDTGDTNVDLFSKLTMPLGQILKR